jgi:hypothetical protein
MVTGDSEKIYWKQKNLILSGARVRSLCKWVQQACYQHNTTVPRGAGGVDLATYEFRRDHGHVAVTSGGSNACRKLDVVSRSGGGKDCEG